MHRRPNPIARFVADFAGSRMYVLGACMVFTTLGLWTFGRIDTGDFAVAVGVIAAFMGGTELTAAGRDLANRPAVPDVNAKTARIERGPTDVDAERVTINPDE